MPIDFVNHFSFANATLPLILLLTQLQGIPLLHKAFSWPRLHCYACGQNIGNLTIIRIETIILYPPANRPPLLKRLQRLKFNYGGEQV